MKSIKEKAEAYDKVLEWATEAHKVCDGMLKEDLEHLFPELKESEDERMIQYFKDLAPFDKAYELYEKYGFSHKDAIAWLKKQCEHANFRNKIQIGDKVTRNEDGVLVNMSQLKRVAKPAEEQGEQKQELLTKEKALKNSPFVEQKHAEWSEEDEKEVAVLEAYIRSKDWSGRHIDRALGIVDELVNKVKSLRPQPKQEWSEEDEQTFIKSVEALEDFGKFELADWLKEHKNQFLKPQNTWKPSVEQMKVCKEVYADILSAKGFDLGTVNSELNRLEEELKKLK